jgi:hypothetical protein
MQQAYKTSQQDNIVQYSSSGNMEENIGKLRMANILDEK